MENFLLFTPMLAEAAVGDVDPRHIVTPIRQLAPLSALVQGEVTAIDTDRKAVTVQPVFGAGPVYGYNGDYRSFEAALAQGSGYDCAGAVQ